MRRGRTRAPEEALKHIEAFRRLERKIGPILNDVVSIFYSLDSVALNSVLDEYERILRSNMGKAYSESARQYACDTFPKRLQRIED